MRRVRLVVHRLGIFDLSELHPHCLPCWLRRGWPIMSMISSTKMLMQSLLLLRHSVESILHYLPVLRLPFSLVHVLVVVLVQYLFLFKIGDVTGAIHGTGPESLASFLELSLLDGSSPLDSELVLLLFDIFHELLYVFDGVQVFGFVCFAAGAVHELVLLAH